MDKKDIIYIINTLKFLREKSTEHNYAINYNKSYAETFFNGINNSIDILEKELMGSLDRKLILEQYTKWLLEHPVIGKFIDSGEVSSELVHEFLKINAS